MDYKNKPWEHYDGLEEVNEACRMGMEALKRQRWIPCRECRYYTSHVCCHPGGMKFASDSDYCSRGEYCSNQSAQVRKKGGIPDAAKENP